MQTILVTGGLGYIGSHIVAELAQQGHYPVILDNLSNSSIQVLSHLEQITGRRILCYQGDVRDKEALSIIKAEARPTAIVHCAGSKAVGESTKLPLKYYDNNVGGLISLLTVFSDIQYFLFSSSATVYSTKNPMPLTEDGVLEASNPYGETKLMSEKIIKDHFSTTQGTYGILRYFNPAGAHPSGLLGDSLDNPANLVPRVCRAAMGLDSFIPVFGCNYETKDGTGIRDYIHIADLASAHMAMLDHMRRITIKGSVFNVGTGEGYSVLDIIATFEKATRKAVPFRMEERRPGDIAECYADCSQMERLTGWKATKTLAEMLTSAWNYCQQSSFRNTNG